MVLKSCAQTTDALQSIVEKIKLFPAPIRLASPRSAEKQAHSSSVSDTVRHGIVLGMTILYYEKAIEAGPSTLSKRHTTAMKIITASIEALRVMTNKSLDRLLLLSGHQRTSPETYSKQFYKVTTKLGKQATQCAAKIETIVEMAHLPTFAKTMQNIRLLPSTNPSLQPEELEFSDLFLILCNYTIAVARTNTEKALIGEIRTNKNSCSTASNDTAATLKMVMERRNAPIEELITCHRKMNGLRVNKAEENGFVSRMKATRREPNWKVSLETNSCSSPTKNNTGDLSWPLNQGNSLEPPQPLLRIDKSGPPGANSAPFDLDDVYDSYHDHDIDATLGLPGSNAVHALTRQPSHKSRVAQTANLRTKAFPIPPPLPARYKAKPPMEVVKLSSTQVMTGGDNLSVCDNLDVVVRAPARPSTSDRKIPAIQEIRDQYY
ncbi:protein of unknown function [Taphrina deformans PYCC 5710]|uniref:Uncharacterized protein n=1 Tax=Taphrina deformans (strain PYCC 5710 / ATCC 11124 / CBS 356.35 / IMI 108563 / JCM 9778 / NBRC 8474) TaxID=1097556 RepID=R4XJQ6_TAPDE|nr:protein of unknown function [Taphrina deformans PYCC 5710]|eukprot:CCG83575.1 protein of unknown function [Taphrina deformans PYCC 5710]